MNNKGVVHAYIGILFSADKLRWKGKWVELEYTVLSELTLAKR